MRYLTFTIFAIIIGVSCTTESEPEVDPMEGITDGFEEAHPIEELSPYPDTQARILSIEDDINTELLPVPLQLLHDFIDNDEQFEKQELTFLATDKDNVYGEPLNDSLLVLLDVRQHRLVQYDLKQEEYETIAPEGRGPGDIFFAEEIQLIDNELFVPMGGFRVSVFDCKIIPCEYDRTFITELNNYSITKNNRHIALLAQPMFTGQEEDMDEYYERDHSIYLLNENGEIKDSFVPIYNSEDPMMRIRLSSEGSVRSFESQENYIVNFSWLPYLYLFDFDTNLTAKYRFPDFNQGFLDLDPDRGASTERLNDESYVTHTHKVDEEWLLITKRERRNIESVRGGIEADEKYIYYAFNVNDHTLYTVGRDKERLHSEQRTIYPTEKGLLVIRDETLHWVSYSQ